MVLPVVLILYIFTALIWNKVYKKREALARIRHDYRNVITSALILMENGSQEKARQILSELTERISATSETPYCAIPVINAVLTEKAAICGKQGILLRTELLLPAVLQVDDFDLCIILGNLIDNAIRACGGKNEKPEPETGPEIRLYAGVVQGYLVIKCENPVFPEGEEKKGTGSIWPRSACSWKSKRQTKIFSKHFADSLDRKQPRAIIKSNT